jgi:hypothetical protein
MGDCITVSRLTAERAETAESGQSGKPFTFRTIPCRLKFFTLKFSMRPTRIPEIAK